MAAVDHSATCQKLNPGNSWDQEEFEDVVARSLIACFETKIKKNRGAPPWDRLNEDRVAAFRREGPYIPGKARLITGNLAGGPWSFDVQNDPLPISGMCAMVPRGELAQSIPNAYLYAAYVRQVPAIGRCWHKIKAGALYEMISMPVEPDGISGDRRFFTVTPRGEVSACTQRLASIRGISKFGERVGEVGPDVKWLYDTGVRASVTLQLIADRRYCWTITAQEKFARAHLGCMMEEVKSLLYARSLPMTDTGRKRPILHLVEAHKRRMRSGTDIDVTAFLRGQQVIEIGGTVFKVNPPATLRPVVSKPSRERYFEAA